MPGESKVGTPEEIYLQPRSEFVARFVGGTNVLPGSMAGMPGIFSIRLEDVGVHASAPAVNGRVLEGTVLRRVFLGSSRDYVIDVAGEEIRATTPLHVDVAPGERVWLSLPPERCRALESA